MLASCSNSYIVKVDKDKRIISRELKNGKVKVINQKYNYIYNQWLAAECASKETTFTKCDDDKVIFTKLAKLKIREMQKNLNSANNEEKSISNREENSSIDNDIEEEDSNNEEQHNFDPENPHHPPMECEGGPEFC